MTKKNFSRRQFLKATAGLGGAYLGSRFLSPLSAIWAQEGLPFEVDPDAVNPLGLEAGKSVEGIFFEGGYGRTYIDNAADIFRKLHPENDMTVEGIQRVQEVLQPRFIAGNPPDVIDNSGAGMLPFDALVAEDQLADFAPLMEALSLDTPGKTFAETLFPGSQDTGVFNGKLLILNISFTVSGVWHSQSLFQEKGWEYPHTWDDMLAFCDMVKATGVSPWTYQGKYPQYMVFGVLMPLVYKVGGMDTLKALDNLEPDAWKSDAVLQAVQMIYQLAENDYILPGTEGLTHTEAQAEWLQGHAVFIPCGTWLENEMRDLTPAGFDMVIDPVPGPTADNYDAILAWPGEGYIVPKHAANVVGGLEFMRCMMSKHNAQFLAQNISAIMPVFGGSEGVELSTALTSALNASEAAGDGLFNYYYKDWYTDLTNATRDAMGELLTKRSTPEKFVDTVQQAADDTKDDPDIPKYTHE